MEIERINENTVKFYISYRDIEDRGFEREEIWYDRERSEQLFWQMMDEVNYREDFQVDGPLWIQVQLLDKGLEITVTKAQVSTSEDDEELGEGESLQLDLSLSEKLEQTIEERFDKLQSTKQSKDKVEDQLSLVIKFADFESIIQLGHYLKDEVNFQTKLFYYEDSYQLYVEFTDDMKDNQQEDILSKLFEFAEESSVSIYVLEEYGKAIIEQDVLEEIREHFPAK